MKKQLIRVLIPVSILIIAALALWFVLSRETPTLPGKGEPQASEERIVENETYYEVEARYPAATPVREYAGISEDAAAVSAMRSFVETEIRNFKEQSGVLTLTPEMAAELRVGPDRKYALGITYETHLTPSVVSYVFDVYLDTGGAHPNAYHRSFSFDVQSGKELAVDDLFEPGTPYLETLSELARARLPGIIAAKGGLAVADIDTTFIADGTEPLATNFSTFYFKGETLVFVFSPYQVGPWVIGTQELPLERSSLANLKAAYR